MAETKLKNQALENTNDVIIPSLSADPAAVNGKLYYNTTTKRLRQCLDGAWQNVSYQGELAYSPAAAASASFLNSIVSADNRSTNEAPSVRPKGLYADFKENGTDGLNDGSGFHGVMTFRSYGSGVDLTGGPAFQLGFTANGNIWFRYSTSDSAWSSWRRFATV